MKSAALALALALALLTLGCRGSLSNGDETTPDGGSPDTSTMNNVINNATPNAEPGPDMSPGNNANPGDAGGRDVSETPFDAGACGGAGFGDDLSVVPVAATTAQGNLYAAPTSAGGAILGWRDGAGVHVTHVDGSGAVLADATVDGTELYGLAAHDGGRAVMVARGTDVLALVILDASLGVVSDQTIIGGVDHDVTNNEWFGPLIRQGTMTWTGTQWATYFTVQRLWNDGVAHYGDQLRLYEPDGSSSSMVWGWGCSHSMEVKISYNGERLGPLCSSDCYPTKGVHFNHDGGQLWPDETGSNCGGQYGTSLGASVPIPGGFWLAFTAIDERQSSDVAIARVDGSTPGAAIWLTADTTDDRALHAANFESDLVVAWDNGASQFALVSGADGSSIAGPVSIPGANLGAASDFFTFSNGDIGWAQPEAGAVGLARLKACR